MYPTQSITLFLPFGMPIFISAFTNASYQQTITVSDENNNAVASWESSGEANYVGTQPYTVPSESSNNNSASYQLTVTVNTQNGSSNLLSGTCNMLNCYQQVVMSDDSSDGGTGDYNDSVIYFTYSTNATN